MKVIGKNKSGINLLLLILFTIVVLNPVIPPSDANAANPIEKFSEIQKELKSKFLEINKARKKETSISEKLDDIDKVIKTKKGELTNYNKRISQTQAEILTLSKEITLLNSRIEKRKEYLKERIMAIYKRQYGGKALILISAKDHQDLIRKSNYLSLMAHYDKTILDEYSSNVKETNLKKDKIAALQTSLVEEKNRTLKKQKDLESDRASKNRLLVTARERRSRYEKEINELEKSSKKLQSIIKGHKTKAIPKAILGNGFGSLRGSLPWPVNGNISLKYGKYNDPEFNVTAFRKGIVIEAKPDDIPKAVAGGRVIYTGNFKGYGKILIIDHGSGHHSLYGNLSEVSLETGELLAKGMDIGKTDKSRETGTPALYFEIRYKGKPVDPMDWLAKR